MWFQDQENTKHSNKKAKEDSLQVIQSDSRNQIRKILAQGHTKYKEVKNL